MWRRTLLFVSACVMWMVAATAQTPTPLNYEVRLAPRGLELLRLALEEERAVSPQVVADSVRAFAGTPDAKVKIIIFEDPIEFGKDGSCFHAHVVSSDDSGAIDSYTCRASDGRVIGMFRRGNPDPELPPIVTQEQAEEIARQFLFQKYPEFAGRQWAQDYTWSHDRFNEFQFNWTQVLNAHGTRAIYDLRVAVQKSTGQVVSFSCPPDRVAGPMVPGITLAQAKALGSEFAQYDPAQVPFSPCYPQLDEDPQTGIQSLWWMLHQVVQVGEGYWIDYVVKVEALAGAEVVPPAQPLGATPTRYTGLEAWRRKYQKKRLEVAKKLPLPANARETQVRITLEGDQPLAAPVMPVLRGKRVWLRVELLRQIGVIPYHTPKGLLLRSKTGRVYAKECGAEYRDYGWWVPLREIADKQGWRVEWSPKARHAVLHRGDPRSERK